MSLAERQKGSLDASTRGRRNRANGNWAAAEVARYLRTVGWPEARRHVGNGWRTGDAVAADPGDIAQTSPGLWWSVKNCQREHIASWVAEMDDKAAGRIGLLVVRRRGHAWPAEWWVWLDAKTFAQLCTLDVDVLHSLNPARDDFLAGWPIRTELRHLVPLLVQAGYGTKEAA